MASPQKENGYTPIANEILEQLALLQLNGTQFRILLTVWRYTYGFSRKEHSLSLNFIANAISCPKSQVKREIDQLIKLSILVVKEDAGFNRTRILSFNKDYTVYRLDDSTLIRVQDAKKTTGEYTNQSTKQYANQSTKKTKSKNENNIGDFFDLIWSLYPKKEGKGQVSQSQKKKLYLIGVDEMARAIDRYKEAKQGVERKYLQNGSTFFNSGYIDYLDENYQSEEPNKLRSTTTVELPNEWEEIDERL